MFRRGTENCCLALVLLAMAGVARASSFDCNKPTTEFARATCRDPALSQLHGELGALRRVERIW